MLMTRKLCVFRGQGQGWGSSVAGLPGPGSRARGDACRRATADRVARWPLVLRVSVPDGECIVVVGIVWSACAALRDSLLATHGTAWNQTRPSASRVRRRRAVARMPDARARMGEAGAARRGHQEGLPRRSGRKAETEPRAPAARARRPPLTAKHGGSHAHAHGFIDLKSWVVPPEEKG